MDSDFNEAIGREQLRLVIRQVPAMQITSVFVALALSYVVRGLVSRGNIFIFILFVSAVTAGRFTLYGRFLTARAKPFAVKTWTRAYLLLALASGIAWGSSAFLLLPHGNPWLLALFVLVIASMAASTTVSHSSVKWAPAAWIAAAMLPYAVRCALDGGEHETILAFLIVLYASLMFQYSLKHHETIAASIFFRFENLKLLEEARESEERYRGLYEKAPAMLHSIDRAGRLLSVSDYWLATLGYAREEVLGRRSVEFLTEESRRHATDFVLPAFMRTGHCKDVEYRFVKKNGEVIDTLLSATAERDAEGNLVRSLAAIVDVTARKRAVEEQEHALSLLRESENRTRSVIDSIPIGMHVYRLESDDRLVFVGANAAAGEILGVDHGRFVGKTIEEAFPGLVATEVPRRYREAAEGGTPWRTEQIDYDEGGIRGAFEVQAFQTGPRQMAAAFIDISDRKRDEEEKARLLEQLQQAMKMEAVGRLAGGVAHDFNNLLTAIIGNVSMALMKLHASDPAARFLAEANKAADRAAALTQQLLAFSRKQIIEPKIVDLNVLIADLGKMLVRLIGENIDLQTIAGQDLGLVKVDPGQFEQILVNLAVNARDAMPEGGKLLVETANADLDEEYCARHPHVAPGRFVMLAVSDSGQGMSDEVKRRIFEPFFTTKPKGSGTGLGLATTYGVVRQSEGSIEVRSEVGKGTTFRIYLPRVEGEAVRPGEPDSPTDLTGGSETVLLVEDEEIVRTMCVRILERLGYRVMQASGGDAAIALARGHAKRIDLLMTDVVMPGMNGRELADLLTRIHPETRVLFTSGYTDDAIVHHGVLDAGVSFIGKPYSPSALAKKVREVLDPAR